VSQVAAARTTVAAWPTQPRTSGTNRQQPHDVLRRQHLPEGHVTNERRCKAEYEPLAGRFSSPVPQGRRDESASATQLEKIPATVGTPPTRSVEFRPPTIVCAWYRPIRSATRSADAERLSTSTWRVHLLVEAVCDAAGA